MKKRRAERNEKVQNEETSRRQTSNLVASAKNKDVWESGAGGAPG